MGAYNFMINAIQSGQLSEQAETIEDLNKKCDLLYEWVQYLNGEIERIKSGECKERESQTLSPVVETSTGLEASVLENGTKCTEEGYCKKD